MKTLWKVASWLSSLMDILAVFTLFVPCALLAYLGGMAAGLVCWWMAGLREAAQDGWDRVKAWRG